MLPLRQRRSGALSWIASLSAFLCATAAFASEQQPDGPRDLDRLCPLVEHERRRDLDDSRFELELRKNEVRARARVFAMIEKLWATRSIEREIYLDYRRLRDRSQAHVARLNTRIALETSIAEQVALACDEVRGQPVERLRERVAELQADYRRLDCELLSRNAEIARIDYEFDKAMLEATRSLFDRNTKSKYELVIDEYDLSQSKARLESYRSRSATCRKRLAR